MKVLLVLAALMATSYGAVQMPSLGVSYEGGVDCEGCKTVVRAAMAIAGNKTEIAHIIEVLVKYVRHLVPLYTLQR
jgi:hypothetical protein